MPQEKGRRTAAQGEVNRIQGNYSEAINCFSAALSDLAEAAQSSSAAAERRERRRIWLLAHRGAAYGAMLAIEEAHKDLEDAIKARKSPYPWALAQLGEAHRLFALGCMAKLDRKDLWDHLSLSIHYFNQGIKHKPGDPWAHAHRGATYANAYWAARRLAELDFDLCMFGEPTAGGPEVLGVEVSEVLEHAVPRLLQEKPETLAKRANEDFQRAFELSPGYAWAYGFHAFQLVLEDKFESAMAQLGKAQIFDVNLRMSVQMLRNMAKLWSYQKQYDLSVKAAWLALQKNPADLVAAYFVAVGLKKQNDPTAPLAIRQTRQLLETAQVGIEYMRLSLDQLEGKLSGDKLDSELKSVLERGDIEVKSIFFHDPTWDDQENRRKAAFSR
ncbi:uncharacterized protein SOCE26_039570 [Sorangium cellulosum]|uniref:Tetratricopeptide repeat protein n=1 Tax=Sorangium cellulosum TaxID=56 RepID=A0A2L0ETB7_SORCE|nr:hypothetical protein [Sorangium cellulosum]AUX42524.1 uncharacterized protein SOCE26_039570 [Sorangium cellulosum]